MLELRSRVLLVFTILVASDLSALRGQSAPSDFVVSADELYAGPLPVSVPLSLSIAPTPLQFVSRKSHGPTAHDIILPLTGEPGIECRSGGVDNRHAVVLTFPFPVNFSSATVTTGIGFVSGSEGHGTQNIIVKLADVADGQRIEITVHDVTDGITTGDLVVPIALLVGDITGDGIVDSFDVKQVKAESGQTVDATNFRADVTLSNSINASDVSLVKSKSGTALP